MSQDVSHPFSKEDWTEADLHYREHLVPAVINEPSVDAKNGVLVMVFISTSLRSMVSDDPILARLRGGGKSMTGFLRE